MFWGSRGPEGLLSFVILVARMYGMCGGHGQDVVRGNVEVVGIRARGLAIDQRLTHLTRDLRVA